MSILRLSRHSRMASTVMIALILFMIVPSRVSADDEPVAVKNIKWVLRRNTVVITYELQGPLNESYEIGLTLLRESNASFQFVPKSVSGDIGSVELVKSDCEIRWDLTKDVPSGLKGEDFYFEITVTPAGGGWGTAATIMALIGAGIVAIVVLRFAEKAPPEETTTALPVPPPRPTVP